MTPLHLEIALHYHCKADQFEMVLTNKVRREYAEDLVSAGMLKPVYNGVGPVLAGFERTEGLAVFVEALCATPLPVQRWVMPSNQEAPDHA